MSDLRDRLLAEIERMHLTLEPNDEVPLKMSFYVDREALGLKKGQRTPDIGSSVQALLVGKRVAVAALRALRREVERHSEAQLREVMTAEASTCCDYCNSEPWPCRTITDTARELGVE